MVRSVSPVLLVIGLLALSACGDEERRAAPRPTPTTAPFSAVAYLDDMLSTMQRFAVNKDAIDWADLRTQMVAAAGAAQRVSDLYPAIELAFRLLGDRESYYTTRDGQIVGPPPFGGCGVPAPPLPTLPDTVGYVKIEGTGAGQSAVAIQAAIRTADNARLIGWIVDLRGNGGGNMWPMIAGVGPVLGEGIIGWIVYNDREYEREYRDGAALSLGEAFASVQAPYTLLKPNPRVAVLTNGLVNSAGEAMAVWFRGRPGTRSFGTPTCGHHHLQQEFRLSDGATLFLTTAQNADRMKIKYSGPVAPDEIIADPGEAVSRAIAWLQSGG